MRLRQSEDRAKFVRTSWWELLAAIPVYIEPTGILRFVRLIVRLRILFNKSRHLKHAYPLEIYSFFDLIWWAMVTITTVGYGDISPVTTGGRIVSMVLMMIGIGFLGLTTGMVARALVVNKQQDTWK